MLKNPIIISKYKNNLLTSKTYNEYISNNNNPFGITNPVTLKKVYELETNKPIADFPVSNWSDISLPNFGQLDSRMKSKIEVFNRDGNSNVLEFSKSNDVHTVYIWGYNKTKVIAEIENIDYVSIPTTTITNLQALSDADNDNCRDATCKEQLLRVALNDLRVAFPNAMITTYTHDYLVGVTSITNPRGESVYYEYDTSNRLKLVRDQNGNILSENEYNYKNQ